MILIFNNRMFLLYLILLGSNRRAGGANHSYVHSNRSFSCTEVKSFHSQTDHEHKTRRGQEIKGGLRIKADRNSNRCICCLSVNVSDTLTGCNLYWTVSCPTWWYAELSEHRSNIQGTSACSCSLHHRHEPAEVYSHYYTSYWSSHTEQKPHSVFRLWQVEWVSSPHPCVLQGPENIYCISGFH